MRRLRKTLLPLGLSEVGTEDRLWKWVRCKSPWELILEVPNQKMAGLLSTECNLRNACMVA